MLEKYDKLEGGNIIIPFINLMTLIPRRFLNYFSQFCVPSIPKNSAKGQIFSSILWHKAEHLSAFQHHHQPPLLIFRHVVKTPTPTPTQHNTMVGFDTKMTVQTTPPPTHPPPTQTFWALLDELES